jgi:hypothetical protein
MTDVQIIRKFQKAKIVIDVHLDNLFKDEKYPNDLDIKQIEELIKDFNEIVYNKKNTNARKKIN